jgi:hypothetical protein
VGLAELHLANADLDVRVPTLQQPPRRG